MRLRPHVLPARLRPIVRGLGQTAVLLGIVTWCVWTLTVALVERDVAERRERFLGEIRYNPRPDELLEAACQVEHLLAPSQRQQLAELCVRAAPPR